MTCILEAYGKDVPLTKRNLAAHPWLYSNSLDHDIPDSAIPLTEEEYAAIEPFFDDVKYGNDGQAHLPASRADPAGFKAAVDLFKKIQHEREEADLRRSEMEELSMGSNAKIKVLWQETQY